jgi:hypothetical protein
MANFWGSSNSSPPPSSFSASQSPPLDAADDSDGADGEEVMKNVDWRWAAQRGFWDSSSKTWKGGDAGKAQYLKLRNERLETRRQRRQQSLEARQRVQSQIEKKRLEFMQQRWDARHMPGRSLTTSAEAALPSDAGMWVGSDLSFPLGSVATAVPIDVATSRVAMERGAAPWVGDRAVRHPVDVRQTVPHDKRSQGDLFGGQSLPCLLHPNCTIHVSRREEGVQYVCKKNNDQ